MKQLIFIFILTFVIACTKDPQLNSYSIEGTYLCTDTFYSRQLNQSDSPWQYIDSNYSKFRAVYVSKQDDGSYLIDQNVYLFTSHYGFSHVTHALGGSWYDTLYVNGDMFYCKRISYSGPNQSFQLLMGTKQK